VSDDIKDSAERVSMEMMTPVKLKVFEELTPAFLGFATRGSSSEPVACYDYDKSSKVLQDRDGMTEEESVEFLEFNYVNAWLGDGTPFFVKVAS